MRVVSPVTSMVSPASGSGDGSGWAMAWDEAATTSANALAATGDREGMEPRALGCELTRRRAPTGSTVAARTRHGRAAPRSATARGRSDHTGGEVFGAVRQIA